MILLVVWYMEKEKMKVIGKRTKEEREKRDNFKKPYF